MIMTFAAPHMNTIGGNESALVMASTKGDLDAFNQLVLSYQDGVFNLAARILGDEDTAEDITQNTFLTAYLNLPRFRNGSFRSWLYRIATNLCYDIHRRYKRYPVLPIENNDLAEEKLTPSMISPAPMIYLSLSLRSTNWNRLSEMPSTNWTWTSALWLCWWICRNSTIEKLLTSLVYLSEP